MRRIQNQYVMLVLSLLFLPSCQLGRYLFYNFADIGDYAIFPARPVQAPDSTFHFFASSNGKYPKQVNDQPFDEFLKKNNTVAFLIIRNDTIHYENYFDGYAASSIIPSFSMAKSITSMLIGCAIDDGLIRNVDEPITNYIPELKTNGFESVTIKHVLQMTSGIRFNESYVNPFGDAASFYYGRNLRKQISRMKLETEPGKRFEYASGNTQLLGLILERSLKGKTITAYLQEKLWTPLGMEYGASWSLDKEQDGIEKTFCCLNARARDFAKLGRLFLNNGNWNGKQIVSRSWVEASTHPDGSPGSATYYQYQWWLPVPNQDFMAEGILGQFIYVNPAKNLIIVRLGKNEGKNDWWAFFTHLAQAY